MISEAAVATVLLVKTRCRVNPIHATQEEDDETTMESEIRGSDHQNHPVTTLTVARDADGRLRRQPLLGRGRRSEADTVNRHQLQVLA